MSSIHNPMENSRNSSYNIFLDGCLFYLYESITSLIKMCKEFSWAENFWNVKPVFYISHNLPTMDSSSILPLPLPPL